MRSIGFSDFARGGGLLSYGPDVVDNFRRATPMSILLRADEVIE
jgi:hypothetical protein